MPKYPNQRPEHRPFNGAEAKVWDWLEAQGWTVTKRGWPDFFCFKEDGQILLVEVKPRKYHQLKRTQRLVFNALECRGIPVRKITLDDLIQ